MKDKNRSFIYFFVLFTGLMTVYLLIKADQMRMSEDEAFSELDILNMNFPYFFGCTPNSHLLNSLCLWIETKIFGFNQTTLRLHSVLSYLIFSWAVYKFSMHLHKAYKRYMFVLLISLHPYMIEYFSLARGYAMSIAFMMMSLCFLYEFMAIESGVSKKKLYFAAFFAALSVLASYVLLTFYLSVLFLYIVFVVLKHTNQFGVKNLVQQVKNDFYFWSANSIFLVSVAAIVIRLNPSSLRAFWPSNDFWGDTFYSIVEMFSIGKNSLTIWVFLFLVVLMILSLSMTLIGFYRKRQYQAFSFFSTIFLVMYGLFMLQFYLLDINYVSYRAAIYLYPLIILSVFWAISESNTNSVIHRIGMMFLVVLTFFVVGNFAYTFSFSRGIDTMPKAPFVEALKDLDAIRPIGQSVSLGVSRAFPATMHYYKIRYGFDWIKNLGYGYEDGKRKILFYREETIAEKYDYFIVEEMELANVTAFQKVVVVKRYPGSPMLLLKSI